MVFNSFSFIFIFFPVFFIAYYRLPPRWRTAALCLGSLAFYGIGVRTQLWQLGLLAGMTALGLGGCALFSQRALRVKPLLALVVAALAAPLVYVKLAGLIGDNAPSLPLGLSFYTFQLIALVVYAYKGGESGSLTVAAGALMFPKLISGPLARPDELLPQLKRPKKRGAMIEIGVEQFILGLVCKVVIADHLGGLLGQIRTWGAGAVSVPMAWLGVIGYAMQLYFDFWGYSRMALGVGALLGIELPENFDHPYCATSVAEFWRRWHITLGEWFKTHVYIPLGGSRHGKARMVFATFAVWLLTGVWHGAGWNFVCWGMLMFLLITGERLIYGRALSRAPLLGHIYVPLVIGLSWVFFFTPGIGEAGAYFLRLVGGGTANAAPGDWLEALAWCWPYLTLGALMCTPLPGRLWKGVSRSFLRWPALFALFWVCMYFMATAASDPFLYFSF